MAKVIVCCKLPNGFILAVKGQKIKINGANSSIVCGTNGLPPKDAYGKTEVDEQVWAEWLKDHKNFAPLVNNAIWMEKDAKSAEARGRELENEASGLEGLSQDGADSRLPKGRVKKKTDGD